MSEKSRPDNDNFPKYRRVLDSAITDTFRQATRLIRDDPRLLVPAMALLRDQKNAEKIRKNHEQNGLLVPPVFIISITSRCNLSCAGCYMRRRNAQPVPDMSETTLASVVSQGENLGVSVMVLAGGEPLMRKDEIISLAMDHPRILFPVFTNGLLIDAPTAASLAKCKNIVPVISFEGLRDETDARRGTGVYDRLRATCDGLKDAGIFFGCSLTVTRKNVGLVTRDDFIREMTAAGARAFVFVEYVPVEPGTENLVLSPDQHEELNAGIAALPKKFPALFIGFPGNDDDYGGCLAAGRGFVHISPSGNLEPCPASPFSDANLSQTSLEDALRSPLFEKIRTNPALLTESEGGCALRAHSGWLADIVAGQKKHGAP
ncbi:MAG TPA: radical SAM protein [Methanoregula sp.]|nr:radical SAM protein [Methanoregula sp.]